VEVTEQESGRWFHAGFVTSTFDLTPGSAHPSQLMLVFDGFDWFFHSRGKPNSSARFVCFVGCRDSASDEMDLPGNWHVATTTPRVKGRQPTRSGQTTRRSPQTTRDALR
jgi:hypothetical protein